MDDEDDLPINIQKDELLLLKNSRKEFLEDTPYAINFFWNFDLICILSSVDDPLLIDFLEMASFKPMTMVHISDKFAQICCSNIFFLIKFSGDENIPELLTIFSHYSFSNILVTSENIYNMIKNYFDTTTIKIEFIQNQEESFILQNIFFKDLENHRNDKSFEDGKDYVLFTINDFLNLALPTICSFYLLIQEYQKSDFSDSEFTEFFIDDFITLSFISNGSYSLIELVLHLRTGLIFALKKFNKKKQYIREKRIYSKLNHPCILHCFGFIKKRNESENFTGCLVLEYMSRGSLRKNLKITNTQKSVIIWQVMNGIDYLHSLGIMHRDIKVDNVLLSRNYDAVLSDFDASCQYLTNTKQTVDVGTLCYISPEAATGLTISFQSDLYSFGLLIYETATEKMPFENISLSEMVTRIQQGDIPPLSHELYGSITYLYKKCTSKEIEARSGSFILLKMIKREMTVFKNTNIKELFEAINKIPTITYSQTDEIIHQKFDSVENNSPNIIRKDVQYIIDKAQEGNPISMFYLAAIYQNGIELPKDEKKAFILYKKAAKEGNVDVAYHNLACCYENGTGTDINFTKMFQNFMKSAELGNENGMLNVGRCYENGKGVNIDKKNAFHYYKQAAELGNSTAQVHLSNCYEYGIGTPINLEKSIFWLHKAAEQGDHYGLTGLAIAYRDGNGVSKDMKHAFKLFKQAAERDKDVALSCLGQCYENGEGTNINNKKAFKCYKKSAENGYDKAYVNLGMCYENGIGTEINKKAAFEAYASAAEKMNKIGMISLARCYKKGIGTEIDEFLAQECLKIASSMT